MKEAILLILLFYALTGFSQKNVVKVGLLGVQYGDLAIGYERVITPQSTINLNLGYCDLKTSIYESNILGSMDDGVIISKLNSGKHAALDYRFYVGKKEAPHGFYLGPYLRYWDYDFQLADEIEGNNFYIDTKANSIGFGLQVGIHWLIYKRISIDWYFLGAGIEKIKLNADYYIDGGKEFDYKTIKDDVKEVFNDISFFNLKPELTNYSDHLNIMIPKWVPGVRTGLTLGIAF